MSKEYTKMQLCEKLGISQWTLDKWYNWQMHQLTEGVVDKPYLPEPVRMENFRGRPRIWTEEMVNQLIEYKSNIVVGRYGAYGAYTNPNHDKKKSLTNE